MNRRKTFMDKIEIEKYKRQLVEIESQLTDEDVKQMSKEEVKEYAVLVAKIKARLDILESL